MVDGDEIELEELLQEVRLRLEVLLGVFIQVDEFQLAEDLVAQDIDLEVGLRLLLIVYYEGFQNFDKVCIDSC